MNMFAKLHGAGDGGIFSQEIDKFLTDLGYTKGGPVAYGTSKKGFVRWYNGDSYDTHVAIIPGQVIIYEEYECGGHVGDADIEIPDHCVQSLDNFKNFFENMLENNKYLFDSSLRGD